MSLGAFDKNESPAVGEMRDLILDIRNMPTDGPATRSIAAKALRELSEDFLNLPVDEQMSLKEEVESLQAKLDDQGVVHA